MYTAVYMCRVLFFLLLRCCPILYVRTWYVSRDPVSCIVRAYLVSYCLRVRQQQRFDHPTLKPTSVLFLGCIKKSTISSKRVHCCIHVSRVFFSVGMLPYIVRTYLVCVAWSCVLYCTCVPGIILSSRATTTAFWPPYTTTNVSSFFGMYKKKHHQQQACTPVSYTHLTLPTKA